MIDYDQFFGDGLPTTQYNGGENLFQSAPLPPPNSRYDGPWSLSTLFGEETFRSLDKQLPQNLWSPSGNVTRPTLTSPTIQTLQYTMKPSGKAPNYSKWHNTTVSDGSLRTLGNQKPEKQIRQTPGRRKGPLKPYQKDHASLIRRKGACLRCRLMKVKARCLSRI